MILNMKDSSALVTVAMLSTMLSERHTDYLDVISPFVLSLLPSKTGARVDAGNIIKELSTKYGFEQFPIHVLQKILIRCSKLKYGYLEKRNGDFFLKKPFESTRFIKNQQSIRVAHTAVMQELQNYLHNNSRYSNITIEKSRELFLLFLEQKGLAFVDGIDELKTVTSKDYDNYQVARFVMSEYAKKSIIFSHIEEVVRGFFVYKSIYFYSRESVCSISMKLKNTSVYLDTSLLIEALGYDTKEGELAAKELLALISAGGGHAKTFIHLVDEVAGILTAFARDKKNRASFRLQHLLDSNYDETNILRLRSALETNLQKIGITIAEPVSHVDLSSDEYSPLQINDLSYQIQTSYKQDFPNSRSDNDMLSVASIYHLRGRARSSSLDNCKAVMVTTNLGFVKAVSTFYKTSTTFDVDYVLNAIDLTAILWLSSWDKKSNLPSIVLLENAFAACQPTPDLINAFAETVEKLRGEGTLSDEEALLLRTQPAPRYDLLLSSQNDVGYVSDKTVLEIRKRYEAYLVSGKDNEIASLQSELSANRRKEQEKKASAIERAESKSNQIADSYKRKLQIAIKVFLGLLFVAGVTALFYSEIISDLNLIWKVPLIIIGLLGLIDVFRSRSGLITRFINIARNKRFDKVYLLEMERVLDDFY